MGYKTYTCPHMSTCGACELLAVPYEMQLQRKQDELAELFAPFGIEPEPIIGMDEPVAYRAKVMTPFQPGPKGKLLHGMYAKGTHEIVPLQECLVEDPAAQPIIATIAELAREFHIPAYQEDTGRGLLRHAIVRVAATSGECMVTLVINRKEFPRKKEFVRALVDEHPEIATVVFNVNTRNTNAVLGPSTSVAYGQGWLEDELCGCTFHIPADAFYQTNPTQTEVLYKTAIRFAEPLAGEVIIDAYCGIGTIGICAAKAARAPRLKKNKKGKRPNIPPVPVQLIGIESTPSAVEIATQNAKLNRVKCADFICGDAAEIFAHGETVCDLVFMDPPRSGASPEFIEGLLAAAPKRIVYISCNPATQVRDLEALGDVYRIKRVVGVDMFPHTKHVETVVLMTRRDAGSL